MISPETDMVRNPRGERFRLHHHFFQRADRETGQVQVREVGDEMDPGRIRRDGSAQGAREVPGGSQDAVAAGDVGALVVEAEHLDGTDGVFRAVDIAGAGSGIGHAAVDGEDDGHLTVGNDQFLRHVQLAVAPCDNQQGSEYGKILFHLRVRLRVKTG